MEVKKSDKANLEKTKALFLQVGLIVALTIVICAFEHKTYDKKEEAQKLTQVVQQVDETVIQTKQDEPEPPKQEVQQQSTTDFKIVDDNVQIKNEFKIETFENTTNGDVFIPKVEVAQTTEVEAEETQIFTVVESPAAYPGGVNALNQYLANNIKYPQQARETGTQGKVYLTFVVERDGSITDIKVQGGNSDFNQEATRTVKSVKTKWKPAKINDQPVRQRYKMPITMNFE